MDDQNKNLILATALSFAVILVWFLLFPPPEKPVDPNAGAVASQTTETAPVALPAAGGQAAASGATAAAESTAARVAIESDRITGSISLQGGRIDQLSLKDYRETLDAGSDIVTLLSPIGSENVYYAVYGWAPGTGLNAD